MTLKDEFVYDPPKSALDILFEDELVLLINKPSGLLSVPGKSPEHQDCLQTRLVSSDPSILLIHRLDMDTSGVMIFAKSKLAQRNLGLQFERRKTQKTYLARVDGHVEGETGQIDLPLSVDWPNRPLQKVDFQSGKAAQTEWKVLARETSATRIALFPKTGRSHQLRVHMAAIGHVILGDRFYGDVSVNQAATRLQLHSETLGFFHPGNGEWLEISSPSDF